MEEILKEFYITNNTSINKEITLAKENTCGVFTVIPNSMQLALANKKTKIKFPSDGTYEVFVNNTSVGVAIYYPALFNSMVSYITMALCKGVESPCASNTPCTGEKIDILNNAYSKLMLYISVNTPKYNIAVLEAIGKIRCSTKGIWNEITAQEGLIGISNTTMLSKVELAQLYLELLLADLATSDPLDHENLRDIYNNTVIAKCITYLGVTGCEPPIIIGLPHEVVFTATPAFINSGVSTVSTLTYQFKANGDTFVSILDSNVPNININKLNGAVQTETVVVAASEEYFIRYSYTRGNVTYSKTVTVEITTFQPQWFGGESAMDNFTTVGGKALVSTIKAAITNVPAVYQSTSNGTSSNTNTVGKYIWWITHRPVKFYIGSFEIPVGPWASPCDPNSYAIISRTITTILEDGETEQTMYYYRTCPLQDLTGQTLIYSVIQN